MINNELRNLIVEEDDIDYDEYDDYYDDDGIEGLDFSVRTYNCLRRAGITTIDQLKQMIIVDLKKIKNLGTKSINEIMQKKLNYLAPTIVSLMMSGFRQNSELNKERRCENDKRRN